MQAGVIRPVCSWNPAVVSKWKCLAADNKHILREEEVERRARGSGLSSLVAEVGLDTFCGTLMLRLRRITNDFGGRPLQQRVHSGDSRSRHRCPYSEAPFQTLPFRSPRPQTRLSPAGKVFGWPAVYPIFVRIFPIDRPPTVLAKHCDQITGDTKATSVVLVARGHAASASRGIANVLKYAVERNVISNQVAWGWASVRFCSLE